MLKRQLKVFWIQHGYPVARRRQTKLGDIVVLNRGILTIPPEEVKCVKVNITIVDGEVKYQRNI